MYFFHSRVSPAPKSCCIFVLLYFFLYFTTGNQDSPILWGLIKFIFCRIDILLLLHQWFTKEVNTVSSVIVILTHPDVKKSMLKKIWPFVLLWNWIKRKPRACFQTVVSLPSPFSPEYINHCTEKAKESVHTSTREKNWRETLERNQEKNRSWICFETVVSCRHHFSLNTSITLSLSVWGYIFIQHFTHPLNISKEYLLRNIFLKGIFWLHRTNCSFDLSHSLDD